MNETPDTDDNGHKLIGAMVNTVLDHVDGQDGEQIDAKLDAVIRDYGGSVSPEDRHRCEAQAAILKSHFAISKQLDQAQADGDDPLVDQLLGELKRLQNASAELSAYRGFTDGAQALTKAKTFADFCMLLPGVALDQLHGMTGGKLSCFPLIWAMSARDKPLERVQIMLRSGARVDLRNRMEETVLHAMAAMNRKAAVRLPILRLLVLHKADINAQDHFGQTPLGVALARGSVVDVEAFLACGARVGTRELEHAVSNPVKLGLVLDHIAGEPGEDGLIAATGKYLRHEIAQQEHFLTPGLGYPPASDYQLKVIQTLKSSLELLAACQGYAAPSKDQRASWAEKPAAFLAVESAETLDAFRAALARVDLRSYPSDLPSHPIYWPLNAPEDRPERLWAVLAAGACVTGTTGNGEALHILAKQRRRGAKDVGKLVQMLVQAGADIEARNYAGDTPLAIALNVGGMSELEALLQHGANPNGLLSLDSWSAPTQRVPALFAAADDARKFRMLLKYGAHPQSTRRGKPLLEFLELELACLEDALKSTDMSGNLRRHYVSRQKSLIKSVEMLKAA